MLNNCSLYKKSVIKPKVSKHGKPIDVGIKNHIFIGYEHTDAIKDYIAKEYWGHLNKRLFYHINYTFRARLLTNEVCQFMWENNNNNHNNGIIGLFHTGLQSSKNGEFLYLIFKPNPEIRKQSWTLPNDAKNVSDYMMTKQEVVSKFGIKPNDLPGIPDYFSKKYYFYPGWRLVLEWDSALRMLLNHKTGGNSKKVILDEFSQNGVTINSNVMRQQLIQPLTNAVNEAMAGYHNDNDYVRPGIYFLDDGYQIVHQMILNVEYPQNSGKITKFVAVFEENKFQKQYTFTRLLNLEMAYKNARLVGKVPQSWCFRENNCVPTKKKQMKPSKPAPILINNYEYINSSVSNNNNNYKSNNNNNNNSNANTNTNGGGSSSASKQMLHTYKLNKGDLLTLTEKDFEAFGLFKPQTIFDHDLTGILAKKIWTRVQMWKHLRTVSEIDDYVLDNLYHNSVRILQTSDLSISQQTIIKLPNWWDPIVHDKLCVKLVLKYGLIQDSTKMITDRLFEETVKQNNTGIHVDPDEQIGFFKKFLLPKKPLIWRLRYVSYVLTHQGIEPTRLIWDFLTLQSIQSPFEYQNKVSKHDYKLEIKKWIEKEAGSDYDENDDVFQLLNVDLNKKNGIPLHPPTTDDNLINNNNSNIKGRNNIYKKYLKNKRGSHTKSLLTSPRNAKQRGGRYSSDLISRYLELDRDEYNNPLLPIQIKGGVTITSLGRIVYDKKGYFSAKYIWPVGYECQRLHTSYINPTKRVIFTSKVLETDRKPMFAVTAQDDIQNPIIESSASTAWTNVIKKVNNAKPVHERRSTCTVSGPEMYGFHDPLTVALIEELPNAKLCAKYWNNKKSFKSFLVENGLL